MSTSRTIDLAIRRRMPHPIAAAWKRVELATGRQRVLRLVACTEITVRTLTAFLLPDYLRGTADDRVEAALRASPSPTDGVRVGLLRLLVQALDQRRAPSPFMPACVTWHLGSGKPSASSRLLDELVSLRNEISHPKGDPSEETWRDWEDRLTSRLRELLSSLRWLHGYRPLRILECQPTRRQTFVGRVQFLTSDDEQTDPIRGEWSAFLAKGTVYLSEPEGLRLLDLTPWLEVRRDAASGLERCYLYKVLGSGLGTIVRSDDATGAVLESGMPTEDGEQALSAWLDVRDSHAVVLENRERAATFRAVLDDADLEPGTLLLDRYEVRGQLGQGGMATVYRAWDAACEREVALKVLHARLALEPRIRARFEREAATMSALRHPHVAPVLQHGRLPDGRPFFTMPAFTGGTLKDAIASSRRDEATVRTWATQALEALAHLHGCGVIHRDVKPTNLILDDEDSLRLSDFGIALREGDARLTATLEKVGSTAYMAPEQVRGGAVSSGVDVHALAMVLHELLTGSLPAGSPGEGLPGPLGRLVRKMGAADPAKRPSAQEALELLRAGQDRAGRGGIRWRETLQRVEDSAVAIGRAIESQEPACSSRLVDLGSELLGDGAALLENADALLRRDGEVSTALALGCSVARLGEDVLQRLRAARFTTDDPEGLDALCHQIHETLLSRAGALLRSVSRCEEENEVAEDFFAGFAGAEVRPARRIGFARWKESIVCDDDLERHDAARALVGEEQVETLRSLAALDELERSLVFRHLWSVADVILLEGGGRARSILDAATELLPEGDLRASWTNLYRLFTRRRPGYWDVETIRRLLDLHPVADRRVLLRCLLLHPHAPYRELALGRVAPPDCWNVVTHSRTPPSRLLEAWTALAPRVNDNFRKIFLTSVHARLSRADSAASVMAARDLVKAFYDVDAFHEDTYFRMLTGLDEPLRRNAKQAGLLLDFDAEYVERFKSFLASPIRRETTVGWGTVSLPVQRRLARRGYFLGAFACHPLDRIALETLPHLLRRQSIVEFLKKRTINVALLRELAKEKNLLREPEARFALVSNPKTPGNIVVQHVGSLRRDQLLRLATSHDCNSVARAFALRRPGP